MMTKHMTHMLLRGLRRTTNAAALLGGGESLDDGEEEVKYHRSARESISYSWDFPGLLRALRPATPPHHRATL
jgi:hypothetical protein